MPEDAYPLQRGSRVDSQFRTTNWLSGTMLELLRQYFGNDERITLEKGTLLWKPDITESKLQIDTVDNVKFDETNKFPKMLVDVDTQEFPEDVIQDMAGYQPDGTINYYNRNQSVFLIECWDLKKLAVAAMADEVRYFLQAYRHVICARYGFIKLRVKTFMKPVKYEKYDDYWVGRVAVTFEIAEEWGTTKESLEATHFSLALNVSARP